ncbi:MAG: helix-hairpin-helix domain-containing protein, partial [Microthrixaceae bacterium]
PRGYRMLAKIPRLPADVINNLVENFGTLEKLSRATIPDMAGVDGVGEHWAETVKDALSRIAESSILDRYS